MNYFGGRGGGRGGEFLIQKLQQWGGKVEPLNVPVENIIRCKLSYKTYQQTHTFSTLS